MPLCKCGKTTINTDSHCNDCEQKILKKALNKPDPYTSDMPMGVPSFE